MPESLQINALLRALELGASLEVACDYVGFDARDIDSELDRLIRKAQATFVIDRLRLLAENPDPQAIVYLLENHGPDRADDNPVFVSVEHLMAILMPAIETSNPDLARLSLTKLLDSTHLS